MSSTPLNQAQTLAEIASWPAVAPLVEEVRDACTQLRWHQALRRRIPEAAAESRVRGARASAELDGARVDDQFVRRLLCGAPEEELGSDPIALVVRGAARATAESERVAKLVRRAPAQALGRLHVAAASDLVSSPEALGRPRRDGEVVEEWTDLAPPPPASAVPAQLQGVFGLLSESGAPAFVSAALAHAELATVRPFVRGNGLVVRALERAFVVESGLDPTGVAVPEVGLGHAGHAAYVGALAAYGTGSRPGVELWLTHWGRSMVAAADEGRRIADAVLAGRLPSAAT